MKRTLTLIAAFAAVVLLTVAAQAESKGEQVFAQKCAMCHKANGKGGSIGPDLSKLSARMKEQDIKTKLENPKKSNPSSSMPAFKTLPKADTDALLGYLKTLK
jgi:mono/diheme cytochrome c family protein